eukprot:scaffold2779_cov114-Isochrysis_galbana.AAC.2
MPRRLQRARRGLSAPPHPPRSTRRSAGASARGSGAASRCRARPAAACWRQARCTQLVVCGRGRGGAGSWTRLGRVKR